MRKKLEQIAQPALDKRKMQPDELKELILSLCREQFLTVVEWADLLNRQAGHIGKRHIRAYC